MTVLYDYWRSSAAYRVRIALNLLGEPYTSVPVNLLNGEHRAADNRARNPQGLVPTLEIDGLRLTQSLAIVEYLSETRSAGFLPDHPAGRARVRALAHAIAMDIAPVCNLSVRNHAAAISGGAVTADDWQMHFMPPRLAALERMLDDPATGTCCHGDTVTLADICLVPQIYNAQRLGVSMDALPRVAAITAHLDGMPAIAAAHPDRVKPPA
jgi:maleylacetoacetate isomerase